MDQEISAKFAEQDKKLDAIFKSTERTRKIFTWTLWITIIMIVLPLIGLVFIIPVFINTLSTSGLGF
ncbi:MAG: hypothetical protein COU11_03065 [Candidatus Harrisonbacteria bacterium CG10_big_fil_rev_8_21_14_0_10_49_15]|uniref:Uncharacterized protein n=1 Tax=Candidatus Harrisonbacteria bacterium CG10_big_fil_rev_8_21_14_0_10_49_15 TaxID=1974587 RepID=A0A2H0UKQ8_9BACT|nr:MAG: hypothetical protein COU11_03065 [Candidatus Harrisonbacteria bacterium CG10_big_fil_rev_8_21_14_0_10_49_15]